MQNSVTPSRPEDSAPVAGPLVSVGMPVYNGERFLQQAIDSVLAQDYPRLEVVLCDNASTDATRAICQQAANAHANVRYVRNPENLGALANYCRVVELARGDFFLWAADDDARDPKFVSKLVGRLSEASDAVLATCKTVYVDESGPSSIEDSRPANAKSRLDNLRILFGDHADGWFYGVFRRDWLLEHVAEQMRYPPWGGDFLWLTSITLGNRVVGDEKAELVKRVKPSGHAPQSLYRRSLFRLEMFFGLTYLCLVSPNPINVRWGALRCSLAWYYRMFFRRNSLLRSLYRGLRLTLLDSILSPAYFTHLLPRLRTVGVRAE